MTVRSTLMLVLLAIVTGCPRMASRPTEPAPEEAARPGAPPFDRPATRDDQAKPPPTVDP